MANGNDDPPTTWMSDVQRFLALLLVGTFTLMIGLFAVRIMWSGDITTTGALLKELKDALVQMVMMALGFFLGNTLAKVAQDKGQQDVVNKLTGQAPPGGPVAPVQPAATVAWWSLMTDKEKAAMTKAGKTDAKIQALIAVFAAGKAEPEHVAALVDAGLLTEDRAKVFKTA